MVRVIRRELYARNRRVPAAELFQKIGAMKIDGARADAERAAGSLLEAPRMS